MLQDCYNYITFVLQNCEDCVKKKERSWMNEIDSGADFTLNC